MKRQEPFWLRDLFIFKIRSIHSSLKRAVLVFERGTICQWKVYERGPFSVKEWYKEYNFF